MSVGGVVSTITVVLIDGGVADVVGAREREQVTAGRQAALGRLADQRRRRAVAPARAVADRRRLHGEHARGEPGRGRGCCLGEVGARRDREAAGRAAARRAAGRRRDAVHLQDAARGRGRVVRERQRRRASLLPASSAEVTVSVGWLAVPSDQVNVFESNGPPAGVESVPGVCVQPVAVPAERRRRARRAGPEPPVSEDRVPDREAAARAAARARGRRRCSPRGTSRRRFARPARASSSAPLGRPCTPAR